MFQNLLKKIPKTFDLGVVYCQTSYDLAAYKFVFNALPSTIVPLNMVQTISGSHLVETEHRVFDLCTTNLTKFPRDKIYISCSDFRLNEGRTGTNLESRIAVTSMSSVSSSAPRGATT